MMTSRRTIPSWAVALLLFAAGCGRLSFDAVGVAGRDGDLGLDIDAPTIDDAGCPTQRITIANDNDDGEIYQQGLLFGGEQPTGMTYPWADYFGYWMGAPTWAFFRFQLPAGTITSAHLDLSCAAAATWDPAAHALRIYAEASADAPMVGGGTDQPQTTMGRPLTTGVVRWPSVGGLPWPVAQHTASPDLMPLLAEAGSVSHVQLWMVADFTTANAEIGTPDFSVSPGTAAALVVGVCP